MDTSGLAGNSGQDKCINNKSVTHNSSIVICCFEIKELFHYNVPLEYSMTTRSEYIQGILGHKHSKTSKICTHVTRKDFRKIMGPLDMVESEKE